MGTEEIIHLKWILDRLINVHGENANVDYMIKFHNIIHKERKESKGKILKQIKVLTKVVKANAEYYGSQLITEEVNNKIKELMKLL